MGEVNSDDLKKSGYVDHFMLVANNRAVLGDYPGVLGQPEPYSTVLTMSTSNDGLGVIPGDLLFFVCCCH